MTVSRYFELLGATILEIFFGIGGALLIFAAICIVVFGPFFLAQWFAKLKLGDRFCEFHRETQALRTKYASLIFCGYFAIFILSTPFFAR